MATQLAVQTATSPQSVKSVFTIKCYLPFLKWTGPAPGWKGSSSDHHLLSPCCSLLHLSQSSNWP